MYAMMASVDAEDRKGGWTAMHDRPQTDADADPWGCVIAWHIHNGAIIINIHNIAHYGLYITHWQPTPAAPMG